MLEYRNTKTRGQKRATWSTSCDIVSRQSWKLLNQLFLCTWAITTLWSKPAEARFASRFSLSAGEVYSDNIFFSEQEEHDFVTVLTPSLHFLYQPPVRPDSLLTVDLAAPAEIYARHSNQTNMGDRLSLRAHYYLPYSARVTFDVDDCFGRVGTTRIGGQSDARQGVGFGTSGSFGGGSLSSIGGGGLGGFAGNGIRGCSGAGGLGSLGTGEPGSILSASDLITGGETIENNFNLRNRIAVSRNISLASGYEWRYVAFLDEGGHENLHSVDVEASYTRWRAHRLYAHYRLTVYRSRRGTDTIHDIDVGDDYFGSRQIRLTPTLVIFGATGISTVASRGKFRLHHKLDVSLVKFWRTAAFTIGVNRGLTSSLGTSGPSFTTSFFSTYLIQLTRRLVGLAAADFSMYDADRTDFKTLQVITGIQYWLTSWMSVNLMYNYRWLDPDRGGGLTPLLGTEKIDSHSMILSLSAYFDIWPRVGLARGISANSPFLLSPIGGGGQTGPSTSTPAPASGTIPPIP